MAEVVSTRLDAGLLERLDDVRGEVSRGAWLAEAAARELANGTRVDNRVSIAAVAAPGDAIGMLGPGTPSPGVPCYTPKCWQRDTCKYGLRGLPLCHACAAAACGLEYRKPMRDLPPAWRKPEAVSQ